MAYWMIYRDITVNFIKPTFISCNKICAKLDSQQLPMPNVTPLH